MAAIADNCDDVFAFIQAVAVKSPRVIAAPLYLRADKRAQFWFRWWSDINLPASDNTAPQYHTGLAGVLRDVETRLKNAEALRPAAVSQRKAEK